MIYTLRRAKVFIFFYITRQNSKKNVVFRVLMPGFNPHTNIQFETKQLLHSPLYESNIPPVLAIYIFTF
jgi:hypothetical protein